MSRHVEGPFFRTSKNTWYVTHVGRKVSLRVSGKKNKKQAIEAWHRLLKGEQTPPTRSSHTIRQAVAEFLPAATVKPSTRELYARHLERLVAQMGTTDLSRLTHERITDWLASLTVSDTTKKIMLSSVGACLGWCVKKGWVGSNPVRRVPKPKGRSRGATSVVSPQQHAKLLKHARPELRVVLQLLHLTGARPAEVCSITAENFDPVAGVVRLADHKCDRTGRDRVIHLPPEAVRLLQVQAKKWGTGHLLRHSRGGAWTRPAVGYQVRRICERIGIKVIPYGYRHTLASDALAEGVPDAIVASLLGHSNTQMLHKHYSHVGERARLMREALGRVR